MLDPVAAAPGSVTTWYFAMNDSVISRVSDHTALRMELLEKMRRLIQGTQHLSKVFDRRWFDEVKEIIYDARDKPGLVNG